jgi:insertion element IS1 protein InsB
VSKAINFYAFSWGVPRKPACNVVETAQRKSQVIPAAQHKAISKLARKTNHIERFNNTLRQRVSRLVRDALSFSKKLANHIGAIKLFICHYNLTRAAA